MEPTDSQHRRTREASPTQGETGAFEQSSADLLSTIARLLEASGAQAATNRRLRARTVELRRKLLEREISLDRLGGEVAQLTAAVREAQSVVRELQSQFASRDVPRVQKRENVYTRFAIWVRRHRFQVVIGLRMLRRSNRDLVATVRASGVVDPLWYFENYADVAALNIDPVLHYALFGKAEGRRANCRIGQGAPTQDQSDCKGDSQRGSPLQIANAQCQNNGFRRPRSTRTEQDSLSVGLLQRNLLTLLPQRIDTEHQPSVDVVVPVYKGLEETLACIQSVLSSPVSTVFELVVIDDAAPDHEMARALDELAAAKLIRLVRNPENQGFVRSANIGLRLNSRRDVVLLNSDTVVYGDWLDRLRCAAYASKHIGTVTPLSNNATICSYPKFPEDNRDPLEIPYDVLDQLAARVNHGLRVEIPTAVGFCMYIRRRCIDDVGVFDAERFGLGYGEENDFCLRASARGWSHLLAADVFVRHVGSVSFQGTSAARMTDALKTLEERFPDYSAEIQRFIRRDPGMVLRERLDLARLSRTVGARCFAIFTNVFGGGADRHCTELLAELKAEGIGAILISSHPRDPNLVEVRPFERLVLPNMPEFDVRKIDECANLMRHLGVLHLHVQHPVRFSQSVLNAIPHLAESLDVSYDVTLHDYTTICPRLFLVDAFGEYCEEPPVNVCDECVGGDGSQFGRVSVKDWRETHGRLLNSARRVFVPSGDVALRLQRYFPSAAFTLRPHAESISTQRARTRPRLDNSVPVRVAVVGAINEPKGFRVLVACAREAATVGRPIHFVIIGYTENDALLADMPNVTITGRYAESDVDAVIAGSECDIGWIPSVCPETYSYTLSHILRAGLYPVAFDIGAVSERIKAIGWGEIMPPDWAYRPEAVNAFLTSLIAGRATAECEDWGMRYKSILRDYYELSALEIRGERAGRTARAPAGMGHDASR